MTHALEFRDELRVPLARPCIALDDRVDVGVGHALNGTNYSFDNLKALNAPCRTQLHDAAEHKPVFPGAKAADAGRQFMGKHWDGAVRKIDTGPTETGFEVEIRSGTDVFSYIRDVYLELKSCAIGALPHQDCIVKIPGRFAVNGDDGLAAKITAAVGFDLVKMRNVARFSEHLVRKYTRQLMLADHHFHVDAKVVWVAKDLDDPTDGWTRGCGPAGNFYVDHQAFKIIVADGG